MLIERFGVRLKSLEEKDLELVRSWRNAPHVKSAMFFQNEISKEEQLYWYKNQPLSDWYFLIYVDNHPIGVCNVKSIDWEKRTGEAGIFIGDSNYLKSMYAMSAVFALMDTFFNEFLFEKLFATVRADRPDLILLNEQLGYQIVEENKEKVLLELTKDRFLVANQCSIRTLQKLGGQQKLSLSDEEIRLFYPDRS